MLLSYASQLKWSAGLLAAALLVAAAAAGAWAVELAGAEAITQQKLELKAGKSVVLKSQTPVSRISIAQPEVADFVLISPSEIYITGKAAGMTNMTLWRKDGSYRVLDLDVSMDISQLKQQLHEIFPGEEDLRVTATRDSVTLSGRMSSAANLSQALALAQSFVPQAAKTGEDNSEVKVNNLVEVTGVQQVMLEVRVAEMQRSLGKRLGINFNYVTEKGSFGVSRLAGLTDLVGAQDANIASPGYIQMNPDGPELVAPFYEFVNSTVNAVFGFSTGHTTWTTFIDALKSTGLVKVLAEPTLIALSGEEAKFLAGGKFPVPVPQGLGTVAIEYKEYGVGLTFTPTVLSPGKIKIAVTPEVSELDFTTAVQFSGFVIPGLTTRKAQTVVELADGQSFAIAGLLKDTAKDTLDKFPLLGDIPVLGALFRSRSFQQNETELVIIATPRLVKPLDMKEQRLPTDSYRQPNDAEFYLLGLLEGVENGQSIPMQGELDGDFGYAMPE